MADNITCDCTDPRDFPQPYESISLTNNIEFVKVDEIYEPIHNQFEIVRQAHTPKQIRQEASAFNIFPSGYQAYLASQITSTGLKLTPVNYTDTLKAKSTYFFINININKSRRILEERCFEIWRTRAGTAFQGSVYFPPELNRFPYVMPSRGVVFR